MKSIMLARQCHRLLANSHLPRLSANDKGDNQVKPVAAHRFPGIYLIVKDPKAARPYLFSDGQNMYNRLVLVAYVQ